MNIERILFVEDDATSRELGVFNLRGAGYEAEGAASGDEGLERFSSARFSLVVTDVKMPGTSGMEVLARVKAQAPDVPVIIMTAYGNVAMAVAAMKAGAADFLGKPFTKDHLLLAVRKALEGRRLRMELHELRVKAAGVERPILFRSAAIRRLLEMTDRVAPSETTVLITGESGTGKELVARRIHVRSGRAEGPFVAVNCAAVPPELLESELFGHERGAFTGAVRARQGRFRQAEGGTLFLDEIAELPLPLQSKLLRVLQERVVDPVGADKPAPVDMRIVAATNRDLRGLAAHGHFREDLYYRLNVVELVVPPLRERAQDIEPLVRHFAAQFARGRDVVVSPALLDEMRRRPWPGNVRELENAVERLVIFCEGDGLSVRDLPPLPEDAGRPAEEGEPGSGDFLQELPRLPAGGLSLLDLEKFVIERVLEVTAGNVSAAARYLRVARHFLTYRMDKFGIERPSINGRVFASSGPIGAASPARERGDHT